MRLATARTAPPADRFVEAEATLSALVNRLQSEETARMSHSDLESLLEQQGREVMRQLLQAHRDWRAQAKPPQPVVGADGIERTQWSRTQFKTSAGHFPNAYAPAIPVGRLKSSDQAPRDAASVARIQSLPSNESSRMVNP